jgi:hypothetical protein
MPHLLGKGEDMNIRVIRFLITLSLSVALLICSTTSTLSQTNAGRVRRNKEGNIVAVHVGRYVNHQYGFSVRIPKGLQATCSPRPMPQHGFTIDLSRKANVDAYVTVFTGYDALLQRTLNGAVAAKLKDNDPSVVLLSKENIRLGNLPAVRIVSKFKDKSGIEKIADEVIAYKPVPKDDAPIIYELTLSSPVSHYKRDRLIFNQVITSWRAVRIS